MSVHLSGEGAIATQQVLLPENIDAYQDQAQVEGSGVLGRLHNKWSAFIATGAAAVALVASPTFEEQSAHASTTPQAVIGMPFEGKWAYSNNVEPPFTDSNSSHPSVHHVPGGGDWGTDLYAAAGEDVKLKATSTGNVSFTWGTGTTSCGQARRINVLVDNAAAGTLYVAHLTEAAFTATAPTNGMTIGKIANLACNPGGTGKHIHVEFKNNSDHSCYTNHGNPGAPLAEGDNLGILGSPNTAPKQACASIPTPETPPPSSPQRRLRSLRPWYRQSSLPHLPDRAWYRLEPVGTGNRR